MSTGSPKPDLIKAALDLTAFFESSGHVGAIVGGLAVGMVTDPRSTDDVDAVVWEGESRIEELISSAEEFGFDPRPGYSVPLGHRTRMLLLRHRATGIDVDVSLGALPFERDLIEKASSIDVGGQIRIARPEHLLVMKAIAGRDIDRIDVERLLRFHPDLDLDPIREQVREFAEVLEIPEISIDFDAAIERVNKSR